MQTYFIIFLKTKSKKHTKKIINIKIYTNQKNK